MIQCIGKPFGKCGKPCISGKIISIIKYLYKSTKCCIDVNRKLREWFSVFVGSRQWLLLMQDIQSLSDQFELIDENLTRSLKHADDGTLIFLIFEKSQLWGTEIHQACNKCGRKRNTVKRKVLPRESQSVSLDGKLIENVNEFVILDAWYQVVLQTDNRSSK